ncbi:MAG TPA: hypothetical protein VNO79_15745 [Actinomycetota bacterium]|nr:hypothetical protein [Actinomycetota bacterium]
MIPTYQRPRWLERALRSVARHAAAAAVVVVDQSDPPAELPEGVTVIRMAPGWPGPRRRVGAAALETDLILFLDDDSELVAAFAEDRAALLATALEEEVGLVSLPLRPGWLREPPDPVGMGGGMLVRREVYWRVGGHGSDYLDDIELSLRIRWGGWRVVRHPRPVSVHHIGAKGGLRLLPGVQPKRDAHHRLSRLDERYPDRLLRSRSSWWGFRERRGG